MSTRRAKTAEDRDDAREEAVEHQQLPRSRQAPPGFVAVRNRRPSACLKASGKPGFGFVAGIALNTKLKHGSMSALGQPAPTIRSAPLIR